MMPPQALSASPAAAPPPQSSPPLPPPPTVVGSIRFGDLTWRDESLFVAGFFSEEVWFQ
jgi:hypothetical protein